MSSKRPGYETSDIRIRLVLLLGLGLFALIGAGALFVTLMQATFDLPADRTPAAVISAPPQTPPQPRLQVAPQRELAAVDAAANRHLQGYAWLDESKSHARIPIERAMMVLAAAGWPDPRRDSRRGPP